MLIITGTYPPERCGVGDYTKCLLSTSLGQHWHLFYQTDWTFSNIRQLCKLLSRTNDEVVNLQYPSMGYSTHLTPHLLALYAVLCLRRKLILTVHEYSQLGWKGKLALSVLFAVASAVVFTTEFELNSAKKRSLFLRNATIVKINSNIPRALPVKSVIERSWDVGYFGYLRPLKGLEEFMEAATCLKQTYPHLKIYVMGQVQPQFKEYAQTFIDKFEEAGITFFNDKTHRQVAEILNDTKVSYLPYPDGLSERRGSFLAAAVNGCIVVSNKGAFTTEQQQQLICLRQTQEVPAAILEILSSEARMLHDQENVLRFVEQNVPLSWDEVAEQYEQVVNEIS